MTPIRRFARRALAPRARYLAATLAVLAGLGLRSELAAQTRDPGKSPPSDPKVVYGALSPLLEYQRRFFERRMIDPAFLSRFNDLVRTGDFAGAAAFVAQSIGVSGAIVIVGPVASASGQGASGIAMARICFGAGALKTCSEWS
ncbi:MAG: hypothetical protein ACKVZ0_21955 [Gemmatimonadales bacterium]